MDHSVKAHLVIEFNRAERDILAVAGHSLGVAFPQIHEPTTVKSSKRPDEQREPLRVIAMGDGRAQATWSHDQIVSAVAVMTTQCQRLEQESRLDYWLALHRQVTGQTILPSKEPTSGYQQYRVLAEIRADQLSNAQAALEILTSAADCASSP